MGDISANITLGEQLFELEEDARRIPPGSANACNFLKSQSLRIFTIRSAMRVLKDRGEDTTPYGNLLNAVLAPYERLTG